MSIYSILNVVQLFIICILIYTYNTLTYPFPIIFMCYVNIVIRKYFSLLIIMIIIINN